MKPVSFLYNKSGLWEKISMVSHEDIFLPLTKHDRNSLKGPSSHVLSYLPGLSVLSLHPSLPLTKWVAFAFQSCGRTASFQSKRHLLHVHAWLPHQMDDKSCPGTEYPISVPPCPGFCSPGPRKATANFFGHNSCDSIQTKAAPEIMVPKW